MAGTDTNASRVGPALPLDLIGRILEAMEHNEKVFNGRLVSKGLRERLSQPCHRTARLDSSLPAAAADAVWQPHLQQAMHQALKHLTFQQKLRLPSVAASSGSQANLALALGTLQPFVFDDFPPGFDPDAGTVAAQSGHLHLLRWLLQHDCPVSIFGTLAAAAEHCNLAGLQQVWELLTHNSDQSGNGYLSGIAWAAGRSGASAIPKLSWLLPELREGGQRQRALVLAAAAAAAAGSLRLLRWLLGKGLDLHSPWMDSLTVTYAMRKDAHWCVVLAGALQHGHVAVADWLVIEAGCPLPQQDQGSERGIIWEGAAGGGSVVAMRWLLRRGVAVHEGALHAAARAGQLEAVQFLQGEGGLPLTGEVFGAAAGSRSVPTAMWLLAAGCPMTDDAYSAAARAADIGMLRWLAVEAGCPCREATPACVIRCWPEADANSDVLIEAVRLLVQAGCPLGNQALGDAALCGRLPLVRYLHEELGMGLNADAMVGAAASGCEVLLEWLVERGCVPGEGEGLDPYAVAGYDGDLATLTCLRRLGVPLHARVLRAAVDAEVPGAVLKWLVEQGAAWDEEALLLAYRWKAYSELQGTRAWFEARLASGRTTVPTGDGHEVAG